jgi:CRP-like cAMP-binding protein
VNIVLASPDGKELIVAAHGPGEFFGDMALLDGLPRSADAMAAEDCRLLIVQRDDFAAFLERHPRAALRLLAVLSRRLRRATRRQREATLLDVAARVSSALLGLAEDRGRADAGPEGDAGPVTVEAPITQAELAATIGVTRESVNKWLRYFHRRGWIRWEKGQLTVLRPDELRRRLV